MDVLDRLRLAEDEQVVVALLVAGATDEAVAAEMVLIEAEALDLRAHGTVEHENALACRPLQGRQNLGTVGPGGDGAEELVER